MSYRSSLYPWVMVRLLPPMPPVVFARFRNCCDAKAYSQTLKQLVPDAKFLIIFDISLPMEQEE
ncbi:MULTISPECIES: hypothetical protein [unclassified Moorena]|uniref:hypothetical protein n=1 Tax=unclassified Moorena TaxID=2683338 RepID=UPI001400C482|nr:MULTISPECIES: hypothetical protein [unclassified Moorena]NEO11886.1 hypothetical protein [Moorena sp. SIO3E8]NEP98730.1 hypothetical protein [Moorena sp. SIO3F7]